jgi:Flp pilus assembly protein TadD
MKMNNLRFTRLAVFGSVALFLASCNGLSTMLKKANQVTYTATPNPLEMQGDSVLVTIKGSFPANFFNKKAAMVLTPVLKFDGGEKAYPAQTLQGEGVESNGTIISYVSGGSFSYAKKIAYTDEMSKSELVLRTKASIKTKSIDLPEVKLATGVVATAKLVHADAKTIKAIDQFKYKTPESREAQIQFLISDAKVRATETKKAQIKNTAKYLDSVNADKNKQIAGVDISAYASPDGPEAFNANLSNNRGTSAEKFYKESFKKNDKAEKATVTAVGKSEDWVGFKDLMQKSNLEDKEMIIRILDMNADPVVREKEIKNMAKAYKKIAKDILPELRRSKMTFNVDKLGKSDSVLLALGQVDTAKLAVEEYIKAASLTKDNDVQIKILNNTIKNFPQEWRAYNNLGVAQAGQKNYDAALTSFLKADELAASGQKMVKNNIGAMYQYKGDDKKAVEYFDLAVGAGKEVGANQGAIKIKEGKYQEAVDLYGSTASFNAALAKLLNGDVNGALNAITAAEDQTDPLGFYLKAIIGARTSNPDLLFTNLRTAVMKDGKLAAKAKKDIEFAKFYDDATFKSIVQ